MRALSLALLLLSGCSLIVGPAIAADGGSTGGGAATGGSGGSGGGSAGGGGGGGGGLPAGGGMGGGDAGAPLCAGSTNPGLDCLAVPLGTGNRALVASNGNGYVVAVLGNTSVTFKAVTADGGVSTLDSISVSAAPTAAALSAASSHYVFAWSEESSHTAMSFNCRLDDAGVTQVAIPEGIDTYTDPISAAVDSTGRVALISNSLSPMAGDSPHLATAMGCPDFLDVTQDPFKAGSVAALHSDAPNGFVYTVTGGASSTQGVLALYLPGGGAPSTANLSELPDLQRSAIAGSEVLMAYQSGGGPLQLQANDTGGIGWTAPATYGQAFDAFSLAGLGSSFVLATTNHGRASLMHVNVSSGTAQMPDRAYDITCAADPQPLSSAALFDQVAIATRSGGPLTLSLCPAPP